MLAGFIGDQKKVARIPRRRPLQHRCVPEHNLQPVPDEIPAQPANAQLVFEQDARGVSFAHRPSLLGRARRAHPFTVLSVRDGKLLIARPETAGAVPVIIPRGRIKRIEVMHGALRIQIPGSWVDVFHGCTDEELEWAGRLIRGMLNEYARTAEM